MEIINPATEDVITTLAKDSQDDIQAKFELLTKGQTEWQEKTLLDRLELINRFSYLLKENIDKLAATLTKEMGKPLAQSVGEIIGARKRIKFFLENSEKWLEPEVVHTEDNFREEIRYEPLGVIANISAWNYPYLVGVNVFIPALIGGNAVLYKPSEITSLTGLEIQRLMHEARIPENIFRTVIGDKDAGETLLDLPLDGYFFTGSYNTGKYIYERVAKKMVPCQMELGGKDPLYVAEDVESIQDVARAAAEGAFYNAGQSCCSVERIYVHEKIVEQFTKAYVKEVELYRIGNPSEAGVFIGPLARKPQLEYLKSQVADAVQKGGVLKTGGNIMGRNGYYFEPTVLSSVSHEMSVMKEESFGPVIGIQSVSNDDEAISLMQDTVYGLTASVYTSDQNRAESIMKKMNTGSVYWNCCDRVSANLPWSGRGNSGIGSTLSHIGIRAFVQPKAYHFSGPQ
ncbi:MAG: aldehyde dehydrogenase [Bacteroidetes bacterium]|nr:MAG: aldehyde dehydrogenase [Bacteroidota bacterium]